MAKNSKTTPFIVANQYGDLRCDCGWEAKSPRLPYEDWERWSITTANAHRATCVLVVREEEKHNGAA